MLASAKMRQERKKNTRISKIKPKARNYGNIRDVMRKLFGKKESHVHILSSE